MRKCRIVFEKTGKAIYISHLDLMHTVERCFSRAGIEIGHTQGFNPHPYIVFALPMSLGTESVCEYLDIQLNNDKEDIASIPERLNKKVPEGIVFIKAYESKSKFKEIAYVCAEGVITYDGGVPENALEKYNELFSSDEIVIKKKTKKGIADADIKPGIKEVSFQQISDTEILVRTTVTAQEPTTNPTLIVSAICEKIPELKPDFSEFKRVKILDKELKEFI